MLEKVFAGEKKVHDFAIVKDIIQAVTRQFIGMIHSFCHFSTGEMFRVIWYRFSRHGSAQIRERRAILRTHILRTQRRAICMIIREPNNGEFWIIWHE
jgi:hypothetical protein